MIKFLWDPVSGMLLAVDTGGENPGTHRCLVIECEPADPPAADRRQTYVVPWESPAEKKTLLAAVPRCERVRLRVIDLLPGEGRKPPRIREQAAQTLALSTLPAGSGHESAKAKLDFEEVSVFEVPLPTTTSGAASGPDISHRVLSGPLPYYRFLAWLGGKGNASTQALPQVGSRRAPACTYLVWKRDGMLTRAQFFDSIRDRPVILQASMEARSDPFLPTSRYHPKLTIRAPKSFASVSRLSHVARLVHWRRQEDFVLLHARSGTGGTDVPQAALVEAMLEYAAMPYVGTEKAEAVKGRGFFVHDLAVTTPVVNAGSDILTLDVHLPELRFGDVFGLVFQRGALRVGIAGEGQIPREVRGLGPDEYALWVMDHEKLTPLGTNSALMQIDIALSLVELCNDVCDSLDAEHDFGLDDETEFRTEFADLLRAGYPDVFEPNSDAWCAPELPVFAMESYLRHLGWPEAYYTKLDDGENSPQLAMDRSAAHAAPVFSAQPATIQLLMGAEELLDSVVASGRWRPLDERQGACPGARQAIPHLMWLTGSARPLAEWISALPADAQFIAWTAFRLCGADIINWLHDADLVPDILLWTNLIGWSGEWTGAPADDQPLFLHMDALAHLRQNSGARAKIETHARECDDQRLLEMSAIFFDPAGSAPARMTYGDAMKLLDAYDKTR